ncbi:MAG: winged helix-turn-helix domain-containing protein [Chloroflexales bacterium]
MAPTGRTQPRVLPASISVLVDDRLHAQVQPILALAAARVELLPDATTFLRHLWERPPDLILIETAEHPTGTIETLVAELHRYFPMPILILEAGASEPDRIAWLDRGADDVLTFYATLAELPARCIALMRRAQRERGRDPNAQYLQSLGMRLDIRARRVVLATGDVIDLNAAQTRLLALLLAYDGDVVPSDVLIRHLFGTQTMNFTQHLWPIIRDLRRRLNQGAGSVPQIRYVHGCGYRIAYSTWPTG